MGVWRGVTRDRADPVSFGHRRGGCESLGEGLHSGRLEGDDISCVGGLDGGCEQSAKGSRFCAEVLEFEVHGGFDGNELIHSWGCALKKGVCAKKTEFAN